ncbi:hypothetical protein S245_063842 [Arachis hypogaea]
MCSSKAKVTVGIEATNINTAATMARINGRPVLQPTCNRVPSLVERRNSIKKVLSPPLLPGKVASLTTPPVSPKSKSPRPPAVKRSSGGSDGNNGLNSSSEKIVIPRSSVTKAPSLERKKSKSFKEGSCVVEASLSYSSSLITDSPGSIAAVRREQMALQQAQRKMRIAHYGRSKSAKFERVVVPLPDPSSTTLPSKIIDEKRCSFITPNSDPIYIAYHDEEWGVPVHDDKMLFELLVLTVLKLDLIGLQP